MYLVLLNVVYRAVMILGCKLVGRRMYTGGHQVDLSAFFQLETPRPMSNQFLRRYYLVKLLTDNSFNVGVGISDYFLIDHIGNGELLTSLRTQAPFRAVRVRYTDIS